MDVKGSAMGKKLALFLAALSLICLSAALVSCKKKEKARPAERPAAEVKGELRVLQASPKGPTQTAHEAEEIVVIFDHPMVALEPLPQEEISSFLKFDPPFSGKSRWLGTKTLVFSPKNRFPFATEIKASIPAGRRSLDGYVLKEDYPWTLTTIRPRLLKHFPQNQQRQLRLETNVLLVFNQPVDESRAKDFISFSEVGQDGQERPLGFSIRRPKKSLDYTDLSIDPEKALLLDAQDKLKPNFTYAVELRAGLPGKEGALGLEGNAVFSFETFKTFQFTGPQTQEGHDPYEPLSFSFSNRVIYKDFVKKIRIEPALEIPDYYSEWDYGQHTLYLSVPLQPETAYAVRIASDLEDEFGNVLGKDVPVRFVTSGYEPAVDMTTGHGIIEAYGGLYYPLYACNAASVRLQAARVDKEEVIPILTNDKIFWSNEPFKQRTDFFQVDKLMELKLPKNKRQLVPLDLKNILTSPYGFLFLQLDTLVQKGDPWGRYPKVFLQVTDLGISGKFSPENNLIWVTELKTGLPVAEAEVEIRDDGNTIRWKGKTDIQGKAQTPGWKLLGIRSRDEWDRPQQWVFVRRGGDRAFFSSNWGTGIEPFRFNINEEIYAEPEKIRGTVFTERGIYRAGEQVHIKGVIRKNEKAQWQLPSLNEVDCEIKDPFEKSVFKGKLPLDPYGSFAFDLETREEASLGTYVISTIVPGVAAGERSVRFSGTFRVEAFRPAEFEVHLRARQESFVFGDSYQAEIRGTYLYGGAMSGQPASWSLRLNPTAYSPPGHKGFVFGDELGFTDEEGLAEKSRRLASGEETLGPQGKLEIKAPLVPEKEKATVSAALEATVSSPSRRSISNRIETLIHQGEYYIGLRPNTSFLKKGEKVSIQVITTNPAGAVAAGKKISLKLIKREWHSVRKAEVGGRFRWVSEKVDTEAGSREVQTKAEPGEISFELEKSGFYLIAAEGEDNRKNKVTTTTYLYVTGKDYVPWERKDDDALELIADSDNYKPGDKARILVKSPYERAKALVTVEREMIMQAQVIEIEGSTSQIEIPIASEAIPNVYVSVLLVQGRTSQAAAGENQDIGKPSFKMGYLKLNVDPSEKRLSVDIATDKKSYKPRDTVTLRLKVRDVKKSGAPASIALAVVDVGVLNLIGYQTPNLFSAFYYEKSLSVLTSETRIHVVGQRQYGEKGENVGGGGAPTMAAPMGLAEVELRGDFKFTAYWNPSLVTDDKGEGSVQFTLPDNLTTFRIMAIAQTKDSRFGQSELGIKVSKPILLLPSAPRFARAGDQFQAGVLINNNSPQRGDVELGIEAKGIVLLDKKNIQAFPLAPGEQKEVLFSFEASKPGKAVLAFRAKMGGDSDGLEITIPIQLPRPTETVATFGQTIESREEKISIPETIDPAASLIEVLAAASALADLKGSVDYLTDYPYLCLEQRLSAILPYLVAPQVIQDFKLSSLDFKAIKKLVQSTIIDAYSYQQENGGFGLWPDSGHESPFVTCYAVFTLLKAREAGYDLDKARLERSMSRLKSLLQAKPDTLDYPCSISSLKTLQAYALYDLALFGRPEPAYAEKLFQERQNLSLFGRALLLKALYIGRGSQDARTTLVQEFLNKIKVTPAQAHFEEEADLGLSWIYSSNTRTTAIILQALLEVGENHPLLPAAARWLVDKRKSGRWNSTQENFFVFYALNDFYSAQEKTRPDFKVEISLAKKVLLSQIFRTVTQTAKAASGLSEFKPGKTLPLKFEKQGPGILYYGARFTYAPRQKLEPREEGFALYKTISSLDGKPLESIKAGSLVAVTLQIVLTKESLFVVIEDPLPAGFEAVNPTFLTESEEQQRSLEAMDETNQGYWWEGFNHIEMHDNRVLLFSDSLSPGIHIHRYLARALTPGLFTLPGTKAEEMYAPEVFGRSAEQVVKIVK
jgi:uncharacterized protein YfaS (alpha-2-macroglobulin family)